MNKNLLSKRSARLLAIIAVAAVVGLIDTIYLTLSHYSGSQVVCSIVDGCNLVLSSSWATIFGVPTALLGGGYYFLILLLLAFFYWWRSEAVLLALVATTTVGFIISLGFLYLQIFVISAICEYCLLSLVATTVIWLAALASVYSRR